MESHRATPPSREVPWQQEQPAYRRSASLPLAHLGPLVRLVLQSFCLRSARSQRPEFARPKECPELATMKQKSSVHGSPSMAYRLTASSPGCLLQSSRERRRDLPVLLGNLG